ncbi:MAG: CPBP family intramembrane metalloprotease [Oscillospiraceae bacterium]|nr:CPBP family intramembrane metalloprotease [Oscillospiraceae bacterium]
MKKKLSALFLALCFPFLYLLVRTVVPAAAYAAALARARERSPGLEEEWLRNQATLSVRAAAPWLLIGSALLTLLIVFLVFRLFKTPLKRIFGEGRLRPITSFTLLELGLGLNIALGSMIVLLPLPETWHSEHTDKVGDPLAAAGWFALFFCTVIAAPLVEEVIFRGLCLRFLRQGFSEPMAVLWQAVLFAAFHGTKLQMVYVLPAAIILGLVYLWCRTLWAPLILHMAFNAASLLPIPASGSVYGKLAWLTAGAAITFLGLRGVYLRRAASIAPGGNPA